MKLNAALLALAAIACLTLFTIPIHSQSNPEPILGIEHIGLNVPDVVQTVDWFTKNLDMKIARKTGDPSNAHFLVDAQGKNMLEVYTNTNSPIPDYANLDPLTLHIAFQVNDVPAARDRLIQAGAIPQGEIATTPLGDTLAMLRTPQGIPIQLTKRAKPMLEIR